MNPFQKPKKEKDLIAEELKKFKKGHPVISKGQLKRITGVKSVDEAGCRWFDGWVDQLVRSNCYPPQLKSDDFYSLLGRYFEGKTILDILEQVRRDYRRAFPLAEPEEPDDNLSWVAGVLKGDPNALILLPPNYLL